MKILMIESDLDKGGIGSVVMTLYRSLISHGISCDLTYYEGNEPTQRILEEIENNGSNVWKLKNFKSAGFCGYISQIKKICKANEYTAVHVHTSLLIWIAGIGARLAGVKKIVGHAHGAKFLNYSQKVLLLLEPIGRLMNRIVCTDFVSCSQVSAKYTFGDNAIFIPNYIPLKDLKCIPALAAEKIRSQLGFDESMLVFGYMGCLDGVKKADFIIEVIAKLREKNVNAVAFLAGNTQRKDCFDTLIKEKGLEKYIRLLGFRKDCDILIQIIDYYITASESEGMSVSLVQAQMLGKPCITSSLLPPENDLKIGLTLRIDGYDSAQWANEIKEKVNDGFKAKSGEDAMAEISESEFSEEIAINKLVNIYNGTCNVKK